MYLYYVGIQRYANDYLYSILLYDFFADSGALESVGVVFTVCRSNDLYS